MPWRRRIKGRHLMWAGAAMYGAWVVMLLTDTPYAGVVISTAGVWVILGYFTHCDEKKRAAAQNQKA
ncbi:hypothetical protein SAMN04487857_1214 [Pseudomonas sp. ok272]|uniref:hypothetical protein n=1 Tax=unclassified Pseudomonas TaxID=196821 RepID=UPI0008BE434D|nr:MULTISPECIES: hypothetical protein [unclassified Pseudomonas]SEN53602.1 hypothetical protein SAMN04487857_1214 [Pseudomonas sp. ok272]SFN35555.1 hypothetical protein SAMN04487858_12158 [Pseudomonas sp. ok602]